MMVMQFCVRLWWNIRRQNQWLKFHELRTRSAATALHQLLFSVRLFSWSFATSVKKGSLDLYFVDFSRKHLSSQVELLPKSLRARGPSFSFFSKSAYRSLHLYTPYICSFDFVPGSRSPVFPHFFQKKLSSTWLSFFSFLSGMRLRLMIAEYHKKVTFFFIFP